MSTVNPDRLPATTTTAKPATVAPGSLRRIDFADEYFKNLKYSRKDSEFSHGLSYGLEKVYLKDYPTETTFLTTLTQLSSSNGSIYFDLPKPKQVVLSVSETELWPTEATKSSFQINEIIITEIIDKMSTAVSNSTTSTEKSAIHVKGRRSINEDVIRSINTGPGAIILKIIDDRGNPRIEIKVGTTGLDKNKVNNYRSSYNNVTVPKSVSNDVQILAKSNKTSVIKIMPNDTVILDGVEEVMNKSLDTNLKDRFKTMNPADLDVKLTGKGIHDTDVVYKISHDKSVINNITNEKDNSVLDPVTNALKVLFHNETKDIMNIVKVNTKNTTNTRTMNNSNIKTWSREKNMWITSEANTVDPPK
ncbi:hypothetical protein K1T71_005390 [Dendrolimus kikuchii]|uniref:Uncharacterized protein n=1 Tax=Dendrolimus kikuchii TaxID=765133 RepID=A0ACC1D480_9NEOP|nr:hypothetical protein K1T71_005390 [Dendrolimus kikuchii]